MKQRTLLQIAAALAALFLAACGGEDTTESAAAVDDSYPLTTCVVSGEALGSMGPPVEVVHEGTTVKLCCKNCIKKFHADPAGYVARLTAEN